MFASLMACFELWTTLADFERKTIKPGAVAPDTASDEIIGAMIHDVVGKFCYTRAVSGPMHLMCGPQDMCCTPCSLGRGLLDQQSLTGPVFNVRLAVKA